MVGLERNIDLFPTRRESLSLKKIWVTYLLRLGKLKLELARLVLNIPKRVFEFAHTVVTLNALL
jgi:hypothetical protein